VIDRLVHAGARVIAYDVQFTEQSPPSQWRDDAALVDAIARAGRRIVLATTETGPTGQTRVLGGDAFRRRYTRARVGNAILPTDPSGVIRRIRHDLGHLDTFAVTSAEVALGRRVPRGPFDGRGAWIDYHGGPGTLRFVSFSDVLRGRAPAATFRNRIVVVGATAPSLKDVAPTSASGAQLASGPEIQAEAISTILRGFPLRDPPPWLGWLLVSGFGLLPGAVAGLRMRAATGLLAGVVLGLAYLVAAQVAFMVGWVVPVVVPLVTLTASAVSTLGLRYVVETLERQRVRDFFAHFVPASVVDEVLEHADEDLRLGGAVRDCTILFSDLRSFTSYSEDKPPDQVIEVLNAYLGEMSDAILDHGGTLVSYLGDGILAVFGAPLDQPDHRDRALDTACEMLARLERFNARMRAAGLGAGFRMGIGINTGPVTCGNVGSERRLEYTVIGDAVNLASRLESMTKETRFQVHVSDTTRTGLARNVPDLELVGELPVRGRRERIKVWGIAGSAEQESVIPLRAPVAPE
jgi:adenylate cyclase